MIEIVCATKAEFEKNLYSFVIFVQQIMFMNKCAVLTHFGANQFHLNQAVFFNLVSSNSKMVNQLLIGP